MRHACESVYILYGLGHVKSKNCTMFSACIICLQHTLAATYSAEHVESTTIVCFREPHNIGSPLISTMKPDIDCFVSPTAKDASEYATNEGIKGVSDVEVGGKEQNHDRFDILEILEDNHQNLDIPDQSKSCLVGDKLLDESFRFRNEIKVGESPVNKNIVINGVTSICGVSVVIPDTIGPVEPVPKYLESAEDNEEAAWDLQD